MATYLVRATRVGYLHNLAGTPGRSSNDFAALAGLDYGASGALRYRALIGYEMRQFDSKAYKGSGAPIVEADVIWTPTGLTTITGTALRAIAEAEEVSVPAYTHTQLSLRVDHEYLRNVLLQGRVGLQNAKYTQGGGQDRIYNFAAGVTWLLNRNVSIGATYNFADRQSTVHQSYNANLLLVEFRFSLWRHDHSSDREGHQDGAQAEPCVGGGRVKKSRIGAEIRHLD